MAQILSQNKFLHCLPKPAVLKAITNPVSPFLKVYLPFQQESLFKPQFQICIFLEKSFLQLQGIQ